MTTCGFGVISKRESANLRASGVGGIAYHYVSDTYVALFSRFIPCGVWERWDRNTAERGRKRILRERTCWSGPYPCGAYGVSDRSAS